VNESSYHQVSPSFATTSALARARRKDERKSQRLTLRPTPRNTQRVAVRSNLRIAVHPPKIIASHKPVSEDTGRLTLLIRAITYREMDDAMLGVILFHSSGKRLCSSTTKRARRHGRSPNDFTLRNNSTMSIGLNRLASKSAWNDWITS
jgi:hypothetical protein